MNKFITSALVAAVLATVTLAKPTQDESAVAPEALLIDEIINMQVKENAVYRITHEELLANDIDMIGLKAKDIAISFKGEAVERHIAELRKDKWTSESYLEFKGSEVNTKDALYIDHNRYQLTLDSKLVVPSEGIESVTEKKIVFESNNGYAWTIPSSDPFYDAIFYSIGTSAGSITRQFTLDEIPQSDTVEITVHASAISNEQHHLVVSLNGTPIGEAQAQGTIDMPVNMTVESSMLHEGSNEIVVTALGGDKPIDVFTYDKLVISYDDGIANEIEISGIEIMEQLTKESITPARGINYVMVTHPMFMGETLDRYVAQRESEDWKIYVVNVEDIYQTYGYGMSTAYAIEAYLKEAKEKGVTHVQLVGAANYDYHDYLGLGSVSFIPSIYVASGTTIYTPSAAAFVADAQGIPQMAIGRWPVRTLEGFEAMVNKSLGWKDSGQSQANSALFIADQIDRNSIDFGTQMDTLLTQFESTGTWHDISRVYLDAFILENNGDETAAVNGARDTIQQTLNSGVSIVSYSGHSSLSTWSYSGLLKQNDITLIDNINSTPIALPLACYTNYADSPRIDTLAHQFLGKGENGFTAVYGASTLSKFSSNSASASKVIEYLLKGETIGEAVRKTKVDLGIGYMDVISNSNLLGDVTIKLN